MSYIVKLRERAGTMVLHDGPLRWEYTEHVITVAVWDALPDAIAHADTLNASGGCLRAWIELPGGELL